MGNLNGPICQKSPERENKVLLIHVHERRLDAGPREQQENQRERINSRKIRIEQIVRDQNRNTTDNLNRVLGGRNRN
jgi:hypothetical protein